MTSKKGQRADYWISRVKEILKQPTRLSPRHRRSTTIEEVNQKKYNNCYGKEQSFLSVMMMPYAIKNKEQHQFALPHAIKEAIYRESHIKVAYLGADIILQLIRERFYWLKMEEEVRHFINHQYPCVRQKKP